MLDFFVFPRELRDLIYIQYAIVDGGYILNPHNNKLKRADERPVSFDLAFMLTCKLVAKEMKGVILAANTLTFSTFYSDGERLNACHFGRLMDNLDNHLIGKLYQWATTCYKDDIAETITNAYPQFKPLLDLIRDDPEFDGLWGLLSRRSCGETPSTYREFVRFALRAVAKRRRRFPKKFAKLSKNRSTHPKLPFKQLLKHIPEPWAIPTSEFVEEMKSIMDDEQHAHRDQDKNKKYHYSAAAVAIRFLRSLSREDRASVRSIVLNEDRAAVSNTECHALGLIPFCQENPHLRIERRSSISHTGNRANTPSSGRGVSDTEEPSEAATLEVRPWFINANVFRTPILIGEVADAAFTTRFRQVITDPNSPQPKHILRLNYAPDRELMSLVKSDITWPTPSRSRFLVEVALKYVSRRYHVVRRSSIMENLEQSIHNPSWGDLMLRSKLWALFAIGELYSTRSIPSEKDFPGMPYFAKASRILGVLDERPGTDSIEIMLLISFYSLALNRRYSAFVMSGTAMRMAIVMGLHLNIPESQLRDPDLREHRKRLFWTTYVFDRIWASKLGHPSAIQDSDIGVDLPSEPVVGQTFAADFDDTSYHIASLRLAALVTKTVRSIYGQRNQGEATLSTRVQQALKDLRAWVEDLPTHLQIDNPESQTGPKPISLHLSFNQLRDAGNFAAQEYCHHVDVMKADVDKVYAKRMGVGLDFPNQTSGFNDDAVRPAGTAQIGPAPLLPAHTTAGMALTEPSLEELLAQPVLDLQFLEASFYDDLQGLYWPDFSTENWNDLA
ncbi:C6 transcription factor [Colletotrichum karsti]|uniref:C6 transcription factor n=1 Tax=Colletotrichum karsti TaxID=1095194 RepID=A0A9P6IB77_9PEZI|nr:C6 transcription factor [Colletotrichum karsti]KAF9878591.1 C6 transcription factor [Colletotrichum karsti]